MSGKSRRNLCRPFYSSIAIPMSAHDCMAFSMRLAIQLLMLFGTEEFLAHMERRLNAL